MRTSRILMVSLLGLPLGGCFGVTLPPQALPDWAVSPQAQSDQTPGAPRKKQRIARQRVPRDLSASDTALVTGGTTGAQPATRVIETKPFAPGWDAPEDQRDPSLRRTLNICRNC